MESKKPNTTKSCRSCKHFKTIKHNKQHLSPDIFVRGDRGECLAFTNQEWFLLIKKVPACFSIVKCSAWSKGVSECNFWEKRK